MALEHLSVGGEIVVGHPEGLPWLLRHDSVGGQDQSVSHLALPAD
jgi:hypothetical protein